MTALLSRAWPVLLEIVVQIAVELALGARAKHEIARIVELVEATDLSATQKLAKARAMLDGAARDAKSAIREDLPDMLKTAAIERAVKKLNRRLGR